VGVALIASKPIRGTGWQEGVRESKGLAREDYL